MNEIVRERPLEFGDDQLTESGAKSAKNSPQRRKGREVQTQSTEGFESALRRKDGEVESAMGMSGEWRDRGKAIHHEGHKEHRGI